MTVTWIKLALSFLIGLTACTRHIDLLNAEYVSMVTDKPPTSMALGKAIHVEWCTNEKPLAPGIGDHEIGYIDQVVLRANMKFHTAYILKPTISLDLASIFASTCVKLSGNLPKSI